MAITIACLPQNIFFFPYHYKHNFVQAAMCLSLREDIFLPKLLPSVKLLKEKVLIEHNHLLLTYLLFLAPTIQVQLHVPGTVRIKKKKKKNALGAPWWCISLRIQCCHYCDSMYLLWPGFSLCPGTSTCHKYSQKGKRKKKKCSQSFQIPLRE